MNTSRRKFIGFISAVIPSTVSSFPLRDCDNGPKWETHYCETGTDEWVNIELARKQAKRSGKLVIFTFNYDRFYLVHPSGEYERQEASPKHKRGSQ